MMTQIARTALIGPAVQAANRTSYEECGDRVIDGNIALFAQSSQIFHSDFAFKNFLLFFVGILISNLEMQCLQVVIFRGCNWCEDTRLDRPDKRHELPAVAHVNRIQTGIMSI